MLFVLFALRCFGLLNDLLCNVGVCVWLLVLFVVLCYLVVGLCWLLFAGLCFVVFADVCFGFGFGG